MEGLAGETPSCWSDLIWGQHTVIIIMIIIIVFQMAESNRSMLCTKVYTVQIVNNPTSIFIVT